MFDQVLFQVLTLAFVHEKLIQRVVRLLKGMNSFQLLNRIGYLANLLSLLLRARRIFQAIRKGSLSIA